MTPLTKKMAKAFSKAFHADPTNVIRQHAVVAAGLESAATNQRAETLNPMVFSLEVEGTGKITDQKSSGRCWLFAALNAARCEIIRKLDLEDFELSENYLLFWDKLEKSNLFLENAVATAAEPLDGRLVSHFMDNTISDGGQWDMYAALSAKYGCVPKYVMPETFHSSNTKPMNLLLGCKLREDAEELRQAAASGADCAALRARMLGEIYSFLAICLGEPPTTFDFEYRDRKRAYHRDAGLTPQKFFAKYVGIDLSCLVSVVNVPLPDRPYNRSYTIAYYGNVVGGRTVRHLNLPFAELRRLALAQLQDGRPVWFACDVAFMTARDSGVMDTDAFDYEAAAGLRLGFGKGARIAHRSMVTTHAMLITGVDVVEGRPVRWKVENSWGEKCGKKGYFVMSDAWFEEYAYQVIVDTKYMTPEQLAAYKGDPIVLNRWDPICCFAE